MKRPPGLPRATDENNIINFTPDSPKAKYSPRESDDFDDDDDVERDFQVKNDDARSDVINRPPRNSRFQTMFYFPLTVLLICVIIFLLLPDPVQMLIKNIISSFFHV